MRAATLRARDLMTKGVLALTEADFVRFFADQEPEHPCPDRGECCQLPGYCLG